MNLLYGMAAVAAFYFGIYKWMYAVTCYPPTNNVRVAPPTLAKRSMGHAREVTELHTGE